VGNREGIGEGVCVGNSAGNGWLTGGKAGSGEDDAVAEESGEAVLRAANAGAGVIVAVETFRFVVLLFSIEGSDMEFRGLDNKSAEETLVCTAAKGERVAVDSWIGWDNGFSAFNSDLVRCEGFNSPEFSIVKDSDTGALCRVHPVARTKTFNMIMIK
jgi:hypothetical protein